jgi:TonB family protein
LKVYKGEELVQSRDYDRDIIKIGRLSSAHLCLDDEKVSRIHSVIEVGTDGSLSIIDMGSSEGTYVNGRRINKGVLTFGDEIRLGDTTIRVTELAAANLSMAAASGSVKNGSNGHADSAMLASQLAQAAGAAEHASPPPPPAHAAEHGAHASHAPSRAPRGASFGPLGLEARFYWGDQMVAEHLLKPQKKPMHFSVGSAEGVDFVMGADMLTGPQMNVVTQEGDNFALHFTSKMEGELTRGGKTVSLASAGQQEGDHLSLPLEHSDFVWVDLGGIRLELCFQPLPKPVWVPLADSMDFAAVNIFLVLFFIAALGIVAALNTHAEGDEYADELSSPEARIAKLVIKTEPQKNKFLQQLNAMKGQQAGQMAAKHAGSEGEMGDKNARKRDARAAPRGNPNEKEMAKALAQRIFGPGTGKGGSLSTILGDKDGAGGALAAARGHMYGSTVGDAQGAGGMGLRGQGLGGGGEGKTIGIGGIGTKGRGGGNGTFGTGAGFIGHKANTDVSVAASEPEVMGSLDKELIRQVIHRNRNAIRFCYEHELVRHPKLSGKVSVKFVISPTGSVVSSQVAQSTAANSALETCVAGRVHTFQFPKPKGGGIVVVTYPFVFKQSGE